MNITFGNWFCFVFKWKRSYPFVFRKCCSQSLITYVQVHVTLKQSCCLDVEPFCGTRENFTSVGSDRYGFVRVKAPFLMR